MSDIKTLKVYLAEINMTLKDFSSLIDCSYRYMSRVMNGHAVPGHRLAKEISQITDGKVKFLPKSKEKVQRI